MPMLTGFPLGDDRQSYPFEALFRAVRWNRSASMRYKEYAEYVENWPIVLDALRQLWEMGKVSELKTPYYEPFEKPANK